METVFRNAFEQERIASCDAIDLLARAKDDRRGETVASLDLFMNSVGDFGSDLPSGPENNVTALNIVPNINTLQSGEHSH